VEITLHFFSREVEDSFFLYYLIEEKSITIKFLLNYKYTSTVLISKL
jgi:hypothetical protein